MSRTTSAVDISTSGLSSRCIHQKAVALTGFQVDATVFGSHSLKSKRGRVRLAGIFDGKGNEVVAVLARQYIGLRKRDSDATLVVERVPSRCMCTQTFITGLMELRFNENLLMVAGGLSPFRRSAWQRMT